MYLPHATSLRMGPLGYQSDAQSTLGVSYNCLRSYADSLRDALTTPYPPYEAIGLRDGRRVSPAQHHAAADRERVLRHDPAQAADPPRRAAAAGAGRARRRVRRGPADGPRSVQPDRHHRRDHPLPGRLPAALPAAATARPTARRPIAILSRNRHAVAAARPRTRADARQATTARRSSLAEWGRELLQECEPIAAALDAAHPQAAGDYGQALARWPSTAVGPLATPSARVLAKVAADPAKAPASASHWKNRCGTGRRCMQTPCPPSVTAR